MSDVSATAPTSNNQIFRAFVLIAVLAGCTWFSSSSNIVGGGSHHGIVLLHLLAFSSWFGCSVWVSFIAGIVMFKTLPRHVFGRLQSKLFPAYFVFSAGAIVVAIATSSALTKSREEASSTNNIPYSLIAILACTLLNLLYFEPATTKVMFQRHAVEKRLGTGHEIGKIRPDDPKKANDPQLKALSKTFGMLHGVSTLLNLGSLGFGCAWFSKCADQMVA
uniref:TMEM205-like domain-containing protein n=1 Tax=Pseudo-nitzschia australis TaxID=44445 RepID=A0A7S4ATM5_9STRA|mmetsp:Transcript_3607/g.7416  ORF Transcript_3607/g.7416 Transcript_3607/m.7416 type:complete len:220 (-) Transcript_3607:1297-1956(-)|eukprot:CAMPEP_0168165236 /NCGR_PEP_ID=MMETSP0139_2-20121125/1378_1 /TAXON_ID=44445 /ORGANISM="Pseudo-nitzschia australis, Strain 10249 10 AB" /LENGTH=219 /DNA_ID=CAMNT_0008082337 /DNA_START=135 /DNA_END=797 /DNA_ORIENTATION=-